MKNKKLILQLKITLKGSKPPIWRRVLVENTASLEDLHYIIQVVMENWDDSHLHEFEIDGQYYGEQSAKTESDNDESTMYLDEIVTNGVKNFMYTYDFGDNWEHEILIEKTHEPQLNQKYPICINGRRACPHEDIGGIWRYEEFAEAFHNPKHKSYKWAHEWYDHDFEAEEFDIEKANKALHKSFTPIKQ